MDLKTSLGLSLEPIDREAEEKRLIEYVNLKLAARGGPVFGREEEFPFLRLGKSLIASYQQQRRLLAGHLFPAALRVQNFLTSYFADLPDADRIWLPADPFVLDRHGLARVLSLPPDRDWFESDIVRSYRVKQGILNNPEKDRRTTEGVFHVAEGGFPIPADKKAVPKAVFARLLQHALHPPRELLELPFTATQPRKAELFISLYLRPTVCPEVPGFIERKSSEVLFFAPGTLVSNLDFVESIFGNAGDPTLSENDAALDVEHWSGHSGAVILAPHLIRLTKKELGLPHRSQAGQRQIRDGMCWESEQELYNEGSAFKITCRDHRGVVVTLIADNYFGYCKKEVKTQLSYAANLFGLCEEEHAGGAIAFSRYDLGEDFSLSSYIPSVDHSFAEQSKAYLGLMEIDPSGYAVDKTYPDIIYIPEDVRINLREQRISWKKDGEVKTIRLLPNRTYVLPSGYKIDMAKPPGEARWRLIGTTAEGAFCHKPCTVSGGGKSEISKSIADAMISGPVFTSDFKEDFDLVEQIINHDFSDRFRDGRPHPGAGRPILSPDRSLGSVLKLLSPSSEYADTYNAWLHSIPSYVRDLVLVVKRYYKPEWGDNWRERFHVDMINGQSGKELKYHNQKMVNHYLRVGFNAEGNWRIFSLRQDFFPAAKIQTEDDISASIVVPRDRLQGLNPMLRPQPAFKFAVNCEYRLFQRPDDAIHRGYDKATEADFARPDNFFSNYEPLNRQVAKEKMQDAIRFGQFTAPMRKMIAEFAGGTKPDFFVSTSQPRIVDGKASKNPRYLQTRPDLLDPRSSYLSELGARFYRRIPLGQSVPFPVNAVLPGRRNNPPDPAANLRPLAVFNPIHYQELPELFMDFIASLTGKSPSTTGAGSEGALTKGPFNALPPIIDLNNALVSYLLTEYACFTTAAGHVGPKYRVDHDISLLVPEIWCRLYVTEQDPAYLIENGFLEKCEDFEYEGRKVLASRLGYRITDDFVRMFFGRVFSSPRTVFSEEMLKPELQDMEVFADGIDNIVSTQRRVARMYFEDSSLELACPPLRALLHIMAHGSYEGKDAGHPEIRALFTRRALMESTWYQARLEAKQRRDTRYWEQSIHYLESLLDNPVYQDDADRLAERLEQARARLAHARSKDHLHALHGTLGLDPAVLPPEPA